MKGACAFVAHGGGPTSVLNATLLGVMSAARSRGIERLFAPLGGLVGLLPGDTVDLSALPQRKLAHLDQQSGSLIGSYRGQVSAELLGRTIGFFRSHDVRYFFYTGGNGSMATALSIARTARQDGYELSTVGIPKTVDNDICRTDHCPGFGSAARFVVTAVREMGLDQRSLPTPVSIIEVMGRDAGWLAASSLLARERDDDPPHFIYVPESPFDMQEFLRRVDRLLAQRGWVVGVVAEGLRDANGKLLAASRGSSRDAKGRPLAGNVAAHLARLVSLKLKVRARSEKPGLLCRAFGLCQSPVDAAEARAIGRFAVEAAVKGHSDVMIAITRVRSKPYSIQFTEVPLRWVADCERLLPRKYLCGPADVAQSYREYAAPLIGPSLKTPVRL